MALQNGREEIQNGKFFHEGLLWCDVALLVVLLLL